MSADFQEDKWKYIGIAAFVVVLLIGCLWWSFSSGYSEADRKAIQLENDNEWNRLEEQEEADEESGG